MTENPVEESIYEDALSHINTKYNKSIITLTNNNDVSIYEVCNEFKDINENNVSLNNKNHSYLSYEKINHPENNYEENCEILDENIHKDNIINHNINIYDTNKTSKIIGSLNRQIKGKT